MADQLKANLVGEGLELVEHAGHGHRRHSGILVVENVRTGGGARLLRALGTTVAPKDVARLSPLLFEHVNVLAPYHFELSPSLAQGALCPFADPAGRGEAEGLEA
ncbi:hypothetical protein DAETH_45570 (plasmid) [Deinococcus aetherius]|uniref:Uncharacterized protein n=1 Tax=Deinococcus aetherius TaxID=200252 RepID=A0ABN6RRM1_9DEIO|nr:hypothetical protein DAETH_45570 [Deinococcus aetherius]